MWLNCLLFSGGDVFIPHDFFSEIFTDYTMLVETLLSRFKARTLTYENIVLSLWIQVLCEIMSATVYSKR